MSIRSNPLSITSLLKHLVKAPSHKILDASPVLVPRVQSSEFGEPLVLSCPSIAEVQGSLWCPWPFLHSFCTAPLCAEYQSGAESVAGANWAPLLR